MEKDLVSIIMPCYNSSKYISQTIESVIAQSYTNWELLITDDCSTDNSRNIVEEFSKSDHRIRLLRLEKNSGAGPARNNSIKEAKGRYIAFLDSDDLWKPEKLTKQLEFMKINKYQFVTCQTEVVDGENKLIGFSKRKKRVSYTSTLIVNYIGTSSVLYDTKDIGKFYMKPIRHSQDWVLWLDILKATKRAYCLNEPLSVYRSTSTSLSSKKSNYIKYHINIYQEVFGFSKLKSYLMMYCLSLPSYLYKKIENWKNGKEYLKGKLK